MTAAPAPTTLLVLAKEPRPGLAKTRLTPPCSPADAASLATAALADTLAVVAETPAARRILVLDGHPGDWLPSGFEVHPQVSGGLDRRIAAALTLADGPAVLVGMDTPQIRPGLLDCDFAAYPAWLGPATDGGFWLIGLAHPDPALVLDVPMSVPETYAAQRRRLLDRGLAIGLLPTLTDVDTWADAEAVAAAHPETRFGSAVRDLTAAPPAAIA